MLWLVLLHALVAAAALPLGRRLGPRVFLVCAIAPAATLVWAATVAHGVLDGEVIRTTATWVPGLGLDLDFRLNAFALLMLGLVSGIGLLVFVYARGYFGPRSDIGRIACILTLFAGAMLGLVLADNVLLLFVFWELTSITSYLLIGANDREKSARDAALQALLVTGAGGLALLAGLVVIATAAGTYSLTGILADPPSGTAVSWALALVLAGAFTKSAQVPFHGWLPGAMAAPTPISAYLHSATMVKAGVYLVAIFTPAFVDVTLWPVLTVTFGTASLLFGGWQALRRTDLKQLLAYGTVSQLGLLIALFGFGDAKTTFAATAMLLAHALFKAALFMVVGIVDHQAHTRDVRRLDGLWNGPMRTTAIVGAIAAASMAAVPLTYGFVAKESALIGWLEADGTLAFIGMTGFLLAAILTVAYATMTVWGAFAPKTAADLDPDGVAGSDVPPPTTVFLSSPLLLAALSLLLGVFPWVAQEIVGPAATSLTASAGRYELHIWPGFGAELLVSLAILALGALLFIRRRDLARLQQRLSVPVHAATVFDRSVHGLLVMARRVTGVMQSGSLPVYLIVVLLTLVILPGAFLLGNVRIPDDASLYDSPTQVAAGVLVVIAAVGVAVTNRRFAAVVQLGAVGYAVAILFVIEGGPDLALTQSLVETVVVVAFVLALRRLPERFPPMVSPARDVTRLIVAGLVGVFVFAALLTAGAARTAQSPAEEMIARSLPEAGGKNVVNVILTDDRAFDTLGEITVLAIASVGMLALIGPLANRTGHTGGRLRRRGTLEDPGERSVVLEDALRLLNPMLLTLAVYLLFAGHNRPGGGFIGGLVAGAAVALRAVSGARIPQAGTAVRIVALGLLVSAGVAITPMFSGDTLLESAILTVEIPLFGTVKLTSALLFDVGVFLVVVGLVVAILDAFGGPEAEEDEIVDAPPAAAGHTEATAVIDRGGMS